MDVLHHFDVLGIGTDILVTSDSTGGAFSICLFHCPPGDGPPPHMHSRGDEAFMVKTGDFEMFDGSEWRPIPKAFFIPAVRHGVHTFRNSGSTPGQLFSIGISGHHDHFLQEISSLQMPRDTAKLMEVSGRYGISYPTADGTHTGGRAHISPLTAGTSNEHLSVLGEDVEVTAPVETTAGRLAVITQTSPPGGGVPVHTHLHEDEIFSVMEGEYEFFNGTEWVRYSKGDVWCAIRGQAHGFRNCGQTDGKVHAMAIPGTGLQGLLEDVSGLKAPEGIPQFMEICRGYGVTFA